MRKSVASYFEAAGGDATQLLGHSSRAVTETYIDPRIVKPLQASALLFRPGEIPTQPTNSPTAIPATLAAVVQEAVEAAMRQSDRATPTPEADPVEDESFDTLNFEEFARRRARMA